MESGDYIVEDERAADAAAAAKKVEAAQEPEPANAFVVSLHALAGIRTDNTMLLPVVIQGERLLALLDTGSTHNFLQGDIMCCLGLQPAGGEHLRVTVANGDRLPCAGVARNVPISIEGEAFSITCIGLNSARWQPSRTPSSPC